MYLSEDFSGEHTVIDTRDANDPDYVPESSKTIHPPEHPSWYARPGARERLAAEWSRKLAASLCSWGYHIKKDKITLLPQDCNITIQAGE